MSDNGDLLTGTKSDIIPVLLSHANCSSVHEKTNSKGKVLEGSVLVHLVKPQQEKIFGEYARKDFCGYLTKQFDDSTERVDVLFDVYHSDSLKNSTRNKRGVSNYNTRITDRTPVPKNWSNFLQCSSNKEQLFKFLAEIMCEEIKQQLLIGDTVRSSANISLEDLQPCNHEEGDTRVILHCRHLGLQGYSNITVDSDVVILLTAFYFQLGLEKVFVAFGQGNSFKTIPVHEIASSHELFLFMKLHPALEKNVQRLYCFSMPSVVDTVSAFAFHGKTTIKTWQSLPYVTKTFFELSHPNAVFTESHYSSLERFVIIMYDKTSSKVDVNKLRKHLFTKSTTSMDRLPPTRDALNLHIKRLTCKLRFGLAVFSRK